MKSVFSFCFSIKIRIFAHPLTYVLYNTKKRPTAIVGIPPVVRLGAFVLVRR